MTNTFLTIVANQNFKYEESINFLKNHFYLDIANSTVLSNNAISFEIRDFDESKKTHMKKVFTQKKIDFCFLNKFKIPNKIFLCDMDSTIIKNETLDDLVKMCGAEAKIIALVTVFSTVHGFWQHINAEQDQRILNYFFSGPELHRWHHNLKPEIANHNYGNNLISNRICCSCFCRYSH